MPGKHGRYTVHGSTVAIQTIIIISHNTATNHAEKYNDSLAPCNECCEVPSVSHLRGASVADPCRLVSEFRFIVLVFTHHFLLLVVCRCDQDRTTLCFTTETAINSVHAHRRSNYSNSSVLDLHDRYRYQVSGPPSALDLRANNQACMFIGSTSASASTASHAHAHAYAGLIFEFGARDRYLL